MKAQNTDTVQADEAEDVEGEKEEEGYQAGFAKLASSGKSISNQFEPTEDAFTLLQQTWHKLTTEMPEKLQSAIHVSDADTQEIIFKFVQQQSGEIPNR